MKKFIFTRFCDHLYYQNDFINFYKDTFDKIYIFCHPSDSFIISKNIRHYPNIEILPITLYKHIGNLKEGLVCKQIYNYAINLVKDYVLNEEVLIYFPDDDEFLDFSSGTINTGINRSVFFDWYLSPAMRTQQLTPLDFLSHIKNGNCQGRLLTLWENPFFKDNIILLNRDNFEQFDSLTMITGFHRVIDLQKRRPIVIQSLEYFVVSHLKGIPKKDIQERVAMKLNLINDKNDWDYLNCSKQYNRLFHDDDYSEWYDRLKDLKNIKGDLRKLIKSYLNSGRNSENLFLTKFH